VSLIAIDCDSVLFPINELVILPLLESRLGRPVSKQEITDWDYSAIPGAKEIAYEAFKRPNLYDQYRLGAVNPDARDGLAILRETYERVIAISSPMTDHASSKWRFLKRCGFAHTDIVLCGDKRLVDFDVLLDDGPQYCLDFSRDHVVVFDQPWNRLDELQDYERAYSWEDVPRKVARLIP